MKNIFTKRIFCLFLIILFSCFFASNYLIDCYAKIDDIGTHAFSGKSMVVMETENNTVLYSKNMLEKLPMASTTKIVTALTVIENCDDLDKLVTIPKKATLVEGSSIYLREGEKLTIRQLLYGLMLQSGNDAALTLALEIGEGDENKFYELMNATAYKCGAKDSNFLTAHGLDKKDHYTTAYDLALITSYALKNKTFKEIVSTKSYKISASENNTARTLINKNKLLSSIDGCVGVKTGYTSKAGRCLVSACEKNGMTVVCVVLNCRPMFEESAELLNLAFNEYQKFEILPSYKFVNDVVIENGKRESTRLYNKQGFSVVEKEENLKSYSVVYNYPDKITAPIEKDAVVGKVEVYKNKKLIFSENLCSIEKVEEIDSSDQIKNILDKW
ncbi:MAG: D-alanyl-D-alanine carboxypeptidase [Clostridia bacterium]|nr:D-alanyl-D-alanine carboxypeptidase [Clostridia bacterium]